MPKTEIDYTNTIIYKIICKDANINDVYVGHTTNFVQRKHAHKQSCIDTKSNNYKCKLYEVIRANGGWTNWKMEIINFFECKDHYEARKKEQEYFISLGATLNSIEPLPKQKVHTVKPIEKEIFLCRVCNIQYTSIKDFEKHNKTKKHIKKINENPNDIAVSALSAPKFECKSCHTVCSRKNDWDRHILTRKHIDSVNGNPMEIAIPQEKVTCKCGKEYANKSGLWKHAKVCKGVDDDSLKITSQSLDTSSNEIKVLTNLMIEMVKSNTDLQKQHNDLQMQMLEVCKNSSITNNINTNNSHNKTFNLQFFLNEQCKDAMNISDFVNSFDLQLSDLESVGDLGYVEGMTKIFLDKLNTMDIYKRPIHCSDTKREILYIKDEDKWEKEKRNNPKLRDAIKHLSFKNMKLTNLWSNTYPESKNNESRLNDVYMKLVLQSTGGSGEIVESENKIIRKIAKEIFIDKNSIK